MHEKKNKCTKVHDEGDGMDCEADGMDGVLTIQTHFLKINKAENLLNNEGHGMERY